MKLETVVPFGRSLGEYVNMFSLTSGDLNKMIIGVGDGPASFNAEMFELGKSVVSIDPLYVFGSDEIEHRFYSVVDDIIDQVIETPDDWVWTFHQSPEHLKENRIATLRRFVADYDIGRSDGRYIVGELPDLDFDDEQFQLALCSHFLFLYSDHLSYDFHLASVLSMLRVASEVRIFPILTLMLGVSPYVQMLIDDLTSLGFEAHLEKVDYEFQKGGNQMLRVQKILR